jgi:vacuolar-type H+-ATPase subunit H
MRDVIQKIVATEDEAKLTVEAARTEADRILSDAQKKGQDIVDRARQEAFVEAERIIEAAVKRAEQEKESRLTDAVAKVESQIQLEPASRKSAVEEVVRCVCK